MSVVTFAETIGNRTHLTKEELNFLIEKHQINEDEALKIIWAMNFSLGRTVQNENEFWSFK